MGKNLILKKYINVYIFVKVRMNEIFTISCLKYFVLNAILNRGLSISYEHCWCRGNGHAVKMMLLWQDAPVNLIKENSFLYCDRNKNIMKYYY